MRWKLVNITIISLGALISASAAEGEPAKKASLTFHEDLRIGGEAEYYAWSGATVAFDVDQRNHIFVVDTGGSRILEFDALGRFVQQIGRKGEGPGEFRDLKSFKIQKDHTAVAFDDLRAAGVFSYYDTDGHFKESKRVEGGNMSLRSMVFSPTGKHAGVFYMAMVDGQTMTYTGLISDELKPLMTFTEKPVANFDQNRMTESAWWSQYYASWFRLCSEGLGMAVFDTNGNIYTAVTSQYKITRYDQNLKATQVFTREYKPIPQSEDDLLAYSEPIRAEILASLPPTLHQYVTPAVVAKAISLAEFPPSKQPIFGMVPMEDGKLLVVHDFNPITNKAIADFFDEKGAYLGKVNLPPVSINIFGNFFGNAVKMIFANGKAYVLEVNEDGETSLVRYRYEIGS